MDGRASPCLPGPVLAGTRRHHTSPGKLPGLVTGIAVAGFAVCGALVGLTGEGMMLEGGTGPFRALALPGLGFLAPAVPAAAQMRFPDQRAVAPAASLRRVELARTVEFRQPSPPSSRGTAPKPEQRRPGRIACGLSVGDRHEPRSQPGPSGRCGRPGDMTGPLDRSADRRVRRGRTLQFPGGANRGSQDVSRGE